MKELHILVEPAQAGLRLDQLVAAKAGLSRARVQQLIEQGHVQVGVSSAGAKASMRVRAGDDVCVRIPAPDAVDLVPQDLQLRALYEDAHLVIIDKPPGIAVHPGAGGGGTTLVHGLLHHIVDLRGIGGELRPGIVHRLDKDTSGCLVVAKSEAALQGLQAAFKAREVDKRYLAIAHGLLDATGELDTLYARHPVDRKRFSSKVKEGKRAITRWRLLASAPLTHSEGSESAGSNRSNRSNSSNKSNKGVTGHTSNMNSRSNMNSEPAATVLEVELFTGRTHQIRAHLADIGHPLLGDVLYGGVRREARLADTSRLKQAALAIGRQALHAWTLELAHPITGARISTTAPIPADLAAALEKLGIDKASLQPSRSPRVEAKRGAPAKHGVQAKHVVEREQRDAGDPGRRGKR